MRYFAGDDFYFDNSQLLSTSLVYANNRDGTATTLLPAIFEQLNEYRIENLKEGIYNLFFKNLDAVTGAKITVKTDYFSVIPVVSEQLAFQFALRTKIMAQMSNIEQAILTGASDSSGMSVSKMDLALLQNQLSKINVIIYHYNAAMNDQSIIPL